MPPDPTAPPRPHSDRWALLIVMAVAFILRVAFPSHMAIEHFDEGVYASNLWFDADNDFRYPARHLYAPPLLPALIEWTQVFASMAGLGGFAWPPMLPSLLAGVGTVGLAWCGLRRWFGWEAAAVGSSLIATADLHAAYSRMALTDVPLGFWMLLGLGLSVRALSQPALLTSVFAGLVISLGWWTKYSGWLPLAVLWTTVVFLCLLDRAARSRWRSLLGTLLQISAVALVAWLPVLYGLQKYGGYASVASNHRQYVVGWTGWGNAAWTQVSHLIHLTPPLAILIWLVVAGGMLIWNRSANRPLLVRLGLIAVASALMPPLLLPISIIGLTVFVWRMNKKLSQGDSNSDVSDPLSFEGKVVITGLWVWVLSLTLMTPTYRPYSRLLIPLMLPVWLSVGIIVAAAGRGWTRFFGVGPVAGRLPALPVLGTALVLIAGVSALPGRDAPFWLRAWDDHRSLERVATQVRQDRGSGTSRGPGGRPTVYYLWGEPALFYALRRQGEANVGPIQSLEFAGERIPARVLLLHGQHAKRSEIFAQQWFQSRDFFTRMTSVPYTPSPLVRSDEVPWDVQPSTPADEMVVERVNK